jgi:hypothetical protein
VLPGTPVNSPPVVEPIATQTVDEGATLDVAVSASDPDGDAITLSLLDPPGFAELADNGDGTGTITIEPGFGDAGVYEITVEVSDGELTDTTSFTVTVVDVNRPPVLEPIVDQTVDEGGMLEIPIVASDPDGDALTLSLLDPPGFAELADNGDGTGTITFEPGFGDAGVYQLFVVASDGELFSIREFTLTVLPDDTPPPPPTLLIPDDIEVVASTPEGAEVTFEVGVDGDAGAGLVPLCEPESGSLFPLGETEVRCSVTDAFGRTVAASFMVIVTVGEETFEGFADEVRSLNLRPRGMQQSTLAKIDNARRQFEAGNVERAIDGLLEVQRHVTNLEGRQFSTQDASLIRELAQSLIDWLRELLAKEEGT